jgi:hypothetical protein
MEKKEEDNEEKEEEKMEEEAEEGGGGEGVRYTWAPALFPGIFNLIRSTYADMSN